MNVLSRAQCAYSNVSAPIRSPRSVEYEALARVTQSIQRAARKGRPGFSELADALNKNRKLWDVFAIDVADPNNSLPNDLRARLFYLAQFTRAHTSQVLARKASVQPLIDVNTAIMRGLRGEHN